MRGIFSSGVLDAFLDRGFQPFDLAIAASAGACNLASHLAGQRGRNRICYTKYMARAEFISALRFLRGGHWVDLDWLWESFERDHPLDQAKLEASQVEFLLSATSYSSGEPVFLPASGPRFMDALKGSCAIPFLYRNAVMVGADRLIDGGVAAPIPVAEAYRRGARHIMVIRSRPPEFVKKPSVGNALSAFAFRRSPQLAAAIKRAPQTYGAALSFIRKPPPDCTIVQVAPPLKLATGRTTQNAGALERDYALGYELGERAVHGWSARVDPRGSQRDRQASLQPS
jgi:predicted patatin/cPLA2 family phospholipase